MKYRVEFECDQTLEITVDADDEENAAVIASGIMFSALGQAEGILKKNEIKILCADSNFGKIEEVK